MSTPELKCHVLGKVCFECELAAAIIIQLTLLRLK